ncbi:hypothetical protein I6854_07820 [Helicobacter pylori]|nr:hypothetical protein [Helicobacter pylori]MBH0286509.1 hypothetical protein [Helicobacter pylori]MBH0298407.1 hypothetical protein [Helicobacter pylori]
MKSIPIKPFDIIFCLNMVCLSVSFTNKPHWCFCGLVLGCFLVYAWHKSLKFERVSELEKDLNMEVTNDEWDTIKKLNEKLKMFLNVEYAFYVFLLVSYLIVGMRVTLSYK